MIDVEEFISFDEHTSATGTYLHHVTILIISVMYPTINT